MNAIPPAGADGSGRPFLIQKTMKILHKLTALAFTLGLAACQTTQPFQAHNQPQPTDPKPPAVNGQNAAQPQQAAQGKPQAQTAPVITLHLAQQKQEKSLVPVNVGGKAPLYALPMPLLTQADMARVSPVTTDKGSFIMLEMNERGIPKLENVTRQAQGNYLLLSVRGQLVDVAQIGGIIKDGRLLMATQNPQHTQAIINLMKGKN